MAENTATTKDRLKEITDSIESGIKDLFQSDKYMQYLRTMSRFHKYSVNNTMLIYLQRPDATLVAGFNKWKDQFERNVKKGEKGIKIIAPTPIKKKIEQQKLDPDTKIPLRNPDGSFVMEEKEVKIPLYKVVSVFDVAQTAGKPLPTLAADLSGNVQNYEVFMEALRRSSPVPITVEAMNADMDGYFTAESQRIAIREGMSEVQTVSATVHEIAHSKLHNKELPEVRDQWKLVMVSDGGTKKDLSGGFDTREEAEATGEAQGWRHVDENAFEWRLEVEEDTFTADFVRKSRNTEEVEAESVSYAVCAYYGIPTGENSFGYIATWSKDKELSELRASLETINKTASSLITDIDRNYAAVMKERGLDKAAPELEQGYPMPDPALTIEDMHSYGYTDGDMLPLTRERAIELQEKDLTVYMLYNDNTEAMAFDTDEIIAFDGIFGISRGDWESFHKSIPATQTKEQSQAELEAAFIHSKRDSYAIYQLKEGDHLRDIRFEPLSWLESKGRTVDFDNYNLVYTREFDKFSGQRDRLEDLWYTFNNEIPDDFHHHSLSVSDIIAIKSSGKVTCHYVDSTDFVELPDFIKPRGLFQMCEYIAQWEDKNNVPYDKTLTEWYGDYALYEPKLGVTCSQIIEKYNHLKHAEMSLEDDYGMIDGIINNGKAPSVAELEADVKAGKAISLLDLANAVKNERKDKRPSVLEQLKSHETKEKPIKTAPKRSAEREL